MDIDTLIKDSEWWSQARAMPDRHYDVSAGISLANHLEAVLKNLRLLSPHDGMHPYFAQLQQAMTGAGMEPQDAADILVPVALLHDIGKTREDKNAEGKHPRTGEMVKMRHPIVGMVAALDLLPGSLPNRDTILALIEEHDTPYSWYMQFQRSGQVPGRKSWARLDRKIDPREDGTGLVLLCVFKLADIDGHENVEDVSWFFERANTSYLREKGKWLPVPDEEAIRSLVSLVG